MGGAFLSGTHSAKALKISRPRCGVTGDPDHALHPGGGSISRAVRRGMRAALPRPSCRPSLGGLRSSASCSSSSPAVAKRSVHSFGSMMTRPRWPSRSAPRTPLHLCRTSHPMPARRSQPLHRTQERRLQQLLRPSPATPVHAPPMLERLHLRHPTPEPLPLHRPPTRERLHRSTPALLTPAPARPSRPTPRSASPMTPPSAGSTAGSS